MLSYYFYLNYLNINLQKGPENVLCTSDNNFAERNSLWKNSEQFESIIFKRESALCKRKAFNVKQADEEDNNIFSKYLYVAESPSLLSPFQLHQYCA